MPKTVLNIRGTHCSGKTTAVRSIIETHPNEIVETKINGWKTSFTILDGGATVVLGRYDQSACGGCDRFKGGNHVKLALKYVAQNYRAETIIYEGIMYSITYKMATEIAQLANSLGYEWESIYLNRDYEEMIKFLKQRNKGKPVNIENVNMKYERAFWAYKKLLETGYNVKFIDVTNTNKEQLLKAIREASKLERPL